MSPRSSRGFSPALRGCSRTLTSAIGHSIGIGSLAAASPAPQRESRSLCPLRRLLQCLLRPQRADLGWKLVDHVVDLARSDVMNQDLEDRARRILRVHGLRFREICADVLEELVERTDLLGFSGWAPRLVIDAAHQHR